MKKVNIYTDGSSLGNPGASGWCALLEYKKKNDSLVYLQISGAESYSTNGRMELKAVIEGLKMLKEPCSVEIFTDSRYVVDSIMQYLPKWMEKGFKNVKHTDLWGEYLYLAKQHIIKVNWIKAHNGHPQNEHCDKVARENAESLEYLESFVES